MKGLDTGTTREFRAIPYAAPPIGELRWRAPRPVVAWRGLRDATRTGPACPQTDEGWNGAEAKDFNEDCLTLDVATPGPGRRPVMVWIHGGSNRAGSGRGAIGSSLSRRGVVLVSIQYRLGLLGFLAHRALAAEQGGHAGNYALMDQIAALKWVRANIAQFGGDPHQVTLFGESAGAQDVALLLAAPTAQGLFGAAILQSGTPGFGLPFRSLPEAFKLGDQLDRVVQSGGDLRLLRRLPLDRVLEAQRQISEPAAQGNDFLFLRTTVDGAVLPASPDRVLRRRKPVPTIIGTNRVEFGPQKGSVNLEAFARFWYGDSGASALGAYRREQDAGLEPRRGHLELRLQSDAQFHCPANRLALLLASHRWPVWRYEFDQPGPLGVTAHALDVGYVFDGKTMAGGASLQDYWVAFAQRRNPDAARGGGSLLPVWSRVTSARPLTILFEPERTTVASTLPRQDFCGWNDTL